MLPIVPHRLKPPPRTFSATSLVWQTIVLPKTCITAVLKRASYLRTRYMGTAASPHSVGYETCGVGVGGSHAINRGSGHGAGLRYLGTAASPHLVACDTWGGGG